MRRYKFDGRVSEDFTTIAVMADFLEEHPELCDRPDQLPAICAYLRLSAATQKVAWQLAY